MKLNNRPLFAVIAIVLLLLVAGGIREGIRMNRNIRKLDTTINDLNSALSGLNNARSMIDSLKTELTLYRLYIADIRDRVNILDLERRKNDTRFTARRDSIREVLDRLYERSGILGPLTDTIVPL